MPGRVRPTRRAACVGIAAALLLQAPLARAEADGAARLAQRGPPTLLVGSAFTLASPLTGLAALLRGRSPRIHACRFGHGLKMTLAGAVLLPAGLVVAPFRRDHIPAAWLDGVVDAFQEDLCSRALGSVYP